MWCIDFKYVRFRYVQIVVTLLTCFIVLNACTFESPKDQDDTSNGPGNVPPNVPTDIIFPDNPDSTSELSARTVGQFDIDGDPISYTFQWYKNGAALAGQTTNTLTADQHTRGDVIGLRMVVRDGHYTIERFSSVTIANSPPIIENVGDPTIYFGSEMMLNASIVDPENDSYTFSWENTSEPPLDNAAITDSNSLTPVIEYSLQGRYRFTLSTSDGVDTSSLIFVVDVEPMDLFQPVVELEGPVATSATAIGDVNGDGLNDVVVTTDGFSDPGDESRVFVYLQNLSGSLDAPIRYDTSLQPSSAHINSVAIADLNSDNRNDIAITYTNGVGVLLQNDQGTLDPVIVYSSSLNFANPWFVRAADFNGDGLNDIAALVSNELSEIYIQNDNSTLDPPVSYNVPDSLWAGLTYGDLNNDGLTDLAIMNSSANGNNLEVLIQQPDNTFGNAVIYDVGIGTGWVSPDAITIADINEDGLDDLIMLISPPALENSIAIFHQNLLGTLDPAVITPMQSYGSAVVVGDVNKDGLNDIIVHHSGSIMFSVYIQTPEGTLMSEQRMRSVWSHPDQDSTAIGDINGDDLLDIVEADGGGISVLYQK